MKRLLFIAVAILLMSAVFSCSYQRVDEQLKTAYRLVNTRPDSSLSLLSHYDQKKMDRSTRAYYALVYTIAQDKSGLDVDNDSLLGYAYDYYRHRPEDSLYAKCLYYMGKYYYLNDSIKQSVELLTESNKMAERHGDLYTQSLALDRLSMALRFSDPHKSVAMAKQAYGVYCKLDSTKYYNKVFLLMGIGNRFKNTHEPDSVMHYMKLALVQAQMSKDSSLIGEAYHSLSVGFRNQGLADSALYYAKQAYNLVAVKKTSLAMQLAMCYSDCDSLNQAESILKQIIALKTNLNTRYSAFYYLSDISMRRTNDQEGKRYVDSTLTYLRRIYYDAQKEISDYQESNENLVEEAELAELKLKSSIFVGVIVIIAISAIIVLLLLNFRNYRNYTKTRRKLEQEQERVRLEQMEMMHRQTLIEKDYEMQVRNRDHEAQIQQLKNEQEKQRLLLKSQERQLAFAKNYILIKLDIENLKQKVKNEKHGQDTNPDVWLELEVALDEIFDGFMSQFRYRHPNLKESDIRFCMLVKLGLSNAELEHFYSRGLQAIKQRLLNLKPKLGIESLDISAREYIVNFGEQKI